MAKEESFPQPETDWATRRAGPPALAAGRWRAENTGRHWAMVSPRQDTDPWTSAWDVFRA